MAIEVHSCAPVRLIAGDVYHWRETPDDIGDVSSMVYYFRSVDDSDVSFSVTGSDETTSFKFELSGATTASLDAAEFTVTKLVTYTWGRETDNTGPPLQLFANPTADPTKSFNQRIVDLLEAHLEGRVPQGLESHTIGRVPINKIPLSEAAALLDRYKAKLEVERNAARKRENPERGSGNTIHIHF